MKKFKNYILMLLVPLILLGCVSKGVSDAVEDTTTSNLGGYTWAQLQAMVVGTNYSDSSVSTNRTYLEYLKNEVSSKTSAVTEINNLSTYLYQSVYTPIIAESASFVYSTSLSKVNTYTENIIEYLAIYDYETLVAIEEQLATLISENLTSSLNSSILSSSDTTLLTYYANLVSTVDAIKLRTTNNVFYSPVYNLYMQYTNNIGTSTAKTYLKNNYSLDVDSIDQSDNITMARTILSTEVNNLASNAQAFSTKSTLQNAMSNLYSVYTKYLAGTVSYANVESIRTTFKNTETSILSSGTIPSYATFITAVYSDLVALDTSGSPTETALKKILVDHIEDYNYRNTEYSLNNYLVINSKVTNIVEEIEYLKSQEDILRNTLKISIPW